MPALRHALLASVLAVVTACGGALAPVASPAPRPPVADAELAATVPPDRVADAGTAARLHDASGRAKPRPAGVEAAGTRSSGRPSQAPPDAGPAPGGSAAGGVASGPTTRVATRVRVPALGIDLPVIRQPGSYPACNVAMYLGEMRRPGLGGPVYLYAHARAGMFLALLHRSQVNNGSSMIGMTVEVYTGDNRRFVYRIDEVRRHAVDLRAVRARSGESLWLQTSEGPRGTVPKLQVGASLVSSGPASDAAAHPVPRPVACG